MKICAFRFHVILCADDGVLPSDEKFSVVTEVQYKQIKSEVKDMLIFRYGSQINNLKQGFLKKRKKGNLPNDAKKKLLQWWNAHYRWPYPTVRVSFIEFIPRSEIM